MKNQEHAQYLHMPNHILIPNILKSLTYVRAQSIPGTGSDLSATKVGTEGVPGAGAHACGPELESNESEFRSDWSNVLEQE